MACGATPVKGGRPQVKASTSAHGLSVPGGRMERDLLRRECRGPECRRRSFSPKSVRRDAKEPAKTGSKAVPFFRAIMKEPFYDDVNGFSRDAKMADVLRAVESFFGEGQMTVRILGMVWNELCKRV